MSILDQLLEVLCCPDDGAGLTATASYLECTRCRRRFRRHADDVVELVGAFPCVRPPGTSEEFWARYLAARDAEAPPTAEAAGWGAPRQADAGWVQLRRRYCEQVVELVSGLLGGRRAVVADISAGAGYVSFGLARRGIPTIHLDLDAGSVAGAAAWQAEAGAGMPLLAVRADYFALPLRRTVDVVISTDTLIRGVSHELALLRRIRLALKDDGLAVVDFHNWMHNPLRRLGLLPDNFVGNRSYVHWELPALVSRAGLEVVREVPCRQEWDQAGLRRLLAPLLPPTRFLMFLRPTRT